MNQYGRKTRKERTIGSSAQVLDTLKKQIAADVAPIGKHVTAGSLADLWVKWVPKYNKDLVPFMAEMPYERKGMFKRCVVVWRAANQDPNAVLKAVVMNWAGFTKHVKSMQGLKMTPVAPSVEFTIRWANEAVAFYMQSAEKSLATVIQMKQPVPQHAVNCKVEEIKQQASKVKINEEEQVATLEDVIRICRENDEAEERERATARLERQA